MAKRSKKTSPLVNSMTNVIVLLGQKSFGKPAHGIILFTLSAHLLTVPLTLIAKHNFRKGLEPPAELKARLEKIQAVRSQNLPPESPQETEPLHTVIINTWPSCLPLLIVIPFWLLFSRTIKAMKTDQRFAEGSGILWFQDLSKPDPYYILPALAVFLSFVKYRMQIRENDGNPYADLLSPEFQRRMYFVQQLGNFVPLVGGLRLVRRPASEVLYLVTSSVFAVCQQYLSGGRDAPTN